MSLTWTTGPGGRVEVTGLASRPEPHVPELEGTDVDEARMVLRRWGELAERHAARAGVQVAWVLALIFQESRGRPDLKTSDGGRGLMMITHPSLKRGLTDEQLLDPDVNVRIGTDLLAALARSSADLVEVASMYNAGGKGGRPHPDPASPWGMRASGDHVGKVVRAGNTFTRWLEERVCSSD